MRGGLFAEGGPLTRRWLTGGWGKLSRFSKKMGKKMDFEVHPIGTAKKMGHCPTEVMTAAQVRFRRTEGWLMWKNGWPEKKSEKPRRVL